MSFRNGAAKSDGQNLADAAQAETSTTESGVRLR